MKFQFGVNQCGSRSAVSDEASRSGSTLLFYQINTFLASDDFVVLPITFANHLDPDQALPFVWPVLDPNWWYSRKLFLMFSHYAF